MQQKCTVFHTKHTRHADTRHANSNPHQIIFSINCKTNPYINMEEFLNKLENASTKFYIRVPEAYAVQHRDEARAISSPHVTTLRDSLCGYNYSPISHYVIYDTLSSALEKLIRFYNDNTDEVRYLLISNLLHNICLGDNPELLHAMLSVPNKKEPFKNATIPSSLTHLKNNEGLIKEFLNSVRYSLANITAYQKEILWNYETSLKYQSNISNRPAAVALVAAVSGTGTSLFTI